MILARRVVAAAAAAMLLAACSSAESAPPTGPSRGSSSSGPGSTAGTTSGTSSDAAATAATVAAARIKALTASLGKGGVSVAAVRTDDGATFHYGATGGMSTASIAKLFILETLLLQRQQAGAALSDADRDAATRMIENSDNAAADQLYADVDTVDGLNKAGAELGLKNTQPGTDYLWGFTTTCAGDYIALLRDLIAPSALSTSNRLFALGLLADVESDQQWGVSAAADKGTTLRLKNGWLPSDPDGGRWIVNSVGIVTVHGHQVLLAVLTQHGASFEGGIALVEKIAKLAAGVVSP